MNGNNFGILQYKEYYMKKNESKNNSIDASPWNCDQFLSFECSQQWKDLQETSDQNIKCCDICNKNVYLCKTPEDFVENGNKGYCVALLEKNFPHFTKHELLGKASKDYVNEHRKKTAKQKAWWKKALSLKPTFNKKKLNEIDNEID